MPFVNIGAAHTKQTVDQTLIQIAIALDAVNTRMVNLAKLFTQVTADEVAAAFNVDIVTAQQYCNGAAMLGQIPEVVLTNIAGLDAFLASVRQLS